MHHSLSTASTIVQKKKKNYVHVRFDRLEKYLFVTIMNEKILTCFITLF